MANVTLPGSASKNAPRVFATSARPRCGWQWTRLLAVALLSGNAAAQDARTIQLHGLPAERVPVVTSLAIQPNGNLLATAGDDHLVRLWDLRDGKVVRTLDGHRDWVTAIAFCSDGDELITGSRDRQVLVWDVATGQRKSALGSHVNPISGIRVSPKWDIVAVAGFRAPLQLYDLAANRRLRSMPCPCNDMRAVAFSNDVSKLAGGGRNGHVRLWDLVTGDYQDLTGHDRRVRALLFTDAGQLVTAGEDQTIRFWDVASGSALRTIRDTGKAFSMTMIGSDVLAVASADNSIRLFRLGDDRPFAQLKGHTGSIAALESRQETLISGSFDTTVRVWPTATTYREDPLATDHARVIATGVSN